MVIKNIFKFSDTVSKVWWQKITDTKILIQVNKKIQTQKIKIERQKNSESVKYILKI